MLRQVLLKALVDEVKASITYYYGGIAQSACRQVLPVATNIEQVKNITTRGGKATKDPPYPKEKQRTLAPVQPTVIEEESPIEAEDLL